MLAGWSRIASVGGGGGSGGGAAAAACMSARAWDERAHAVALNLQRRIDLSVMLAGWSRIASVDGGGGGDGAVTAAQQQRRAYPRAHGTSVRMLWHGICKGEWICE